MREREVKSLRRILILIAIPSVLVAAALAYQRYSSRGLTNFELSGAEHLAGQWALADGEKDPKGEKGAVLFERIRRKCLQTHGSPTLGFKKQHELLQECLDNSESSNRVYAVNPNLEAISRTDLSWWPHGPLLLPSASPSDVKETLYAASAKEGLKGNPEREAAGIIAIYHTAPYTPSRYSYDDVLRHGGLTVAVSWTPARQEYRSDRDELGRTITVRGRAAFLLEIRSDEKEDTTKGWFSGRVDRRFVYWDSLRDANGRLRWEVSNNPKKMSELETLQFINALEEVAP